MTDINPRGIVLLALIGAAVATLCDGIHVYTGTLAYPKHNWFGQPWWVFPNFFVVFVGMALIYRVLSAVFPGTDSTTLSTSPGDLRAFIETLTLFALVYILSGFGNRDPQALCLIFYISFLLRWLVTYDRGFMLVLALLMAVGGMVGEGLLTKMDMVHYRAPEIFGVPWWLGGLYMHGAFALREGYRRFVVG